MTTVASRMESDGGRHSACRHRVPGACLAAIFMCLGLILAAPSLAQDRKESRADMEARLQEYKRNLEANRNREQAITSDIDKLANDRARLNTRLIETGKNVQRIEGRMTFLEGRLAKLATERDALRTQLSTQNRHIMKLLGAMQRMGRDPPPVIITQRSDALGMVRSAMLLAKAFPELKGQADIITTQLTSLSRVMAQHKQESERLRAESISLSDASTELAALVEEKRRSLQTRKQELVELRRTSKQLSQDATELEDLIAKLDSAVASNTRLGAYNAKIAPQIEGAEPGASAQPGPPTATTPSPRPEAPKVAQPPTAAPGAPASKPELPGAIEVAPEAGTQVASAGRLEPSVPFFKAKATLPFPVVGEKVVDFGDKLEYGDKSRGLVLKTRHNGRVVSPSDGWVVYAGEFRSYGQLLIINAGAGYHILLAGLSRIDVQLGQFVLTGEPVGSMPGTPRDGAGNAAPPLYVEFRHKGQPIDPSPWWASGQQKVQG